MNPMSPRSTHTACITLLLALMLALPAHATETWSFGVLAQRSAVLTAQYWNPLLDYVQRKTGIRLELKAARSAPESNDAIERGEYDFAYANTIFHPRMAPANYQVILRPRDAAITGQIVVLEDAPIRTLKELEGREVGFPSPGAFVGYAVPMDALLRQAVNVTPVFGGNQEGIMGQLKAGRVVAAGVNNQVMKAYAARENIRYRVLWESQPFNNLPIAAHPRVPAATVQAVQAAFDGMDSDPEGMKLLEASARVIGQKPPFGFRTATPADYRSYTEFHRDSRVKDAR
jgi:phosphonate transport system substrate-binding protein